MKRKAAFRRCLPVRLSDGSKKTCTRLVSPRPPTVIFTRALPRVQGPTALFFLLPVLSFCYLSSVQLWRNFLITKIANLDYFKVRKYFLFFFRRRLKKGDDVPKINLLNQKKIEVTRLIDILNSPLSDCLL